jgi:hypothetical protein
MPSKNSMSPTRVGYLSGVSKPSGIFVLYPGVGSSAAAGELHNITGKSVAARSALNVVMSFPLKRPTKPSEGSALHCLKFGIVAAQRDDQEHELVVVAAVAIMIVLK